MSFLKRQKKVFSNFILQITKKKFNILIDQNGKPTGGIGHMM